MGDGRRAMGDAGDGRRARAAGDGRRRLTLRVTRARYVRECENRTVAGSSPTEIWMRGSSPWTIVVEIYRVTRVFPAEERFGLIAQLRRAALCRFRPTSPKARGRLGAARVSTICHRSRAARRLKSRHRCAVAVALGFIGWRRNRVSFRAKLRSARAKCCSACYRSLGAGRAAAGGRRARGGGRRRARAYGRRGAGDGGPGDRRVAAGDG